MCLGWSESRLGRVLSEPRVRTAHAVMPVRLHLCPVLPAQGMVMRFTWPILRPGRASALP